MDWKRIARRVFHGVNTWLLLAFTAAAQAQLTNSWIAGNGNWEIQAKWSLGVPPSTNQAIVGITNATSKTVKIDNQTVSANALNGCMTISNFAILGFGSGINTLEISNAGTATPLH